MFGFYFENLRDRLEMIENLRQQKYNYEPGLWNPDSILLGGLGILFASSIFLD